MQLVTTTIVSLPASKEDLMPSLEKNMADDVALMDNEGNWRDMSESIGGSTKKRTGWSAIRGTD